MGAQAAALGPADRGDDGPTVRISDELRAIYRGLRPHGRAPASPEPDENWLKAGIGVVSGGGPKRGAQQAWRLRRDGRRPFVFAGLSIIDASVRCSAETLSLPDSQNVPELVHRFRLFVSSDSSVIVQAALEVAPETSLRPVFTVWQFHDSISRGDWWSAHDPACALPITGCGGQSAELAKAAAMLRCQYRDLLNRYCGLGTN